MLVKPMFFHRPSMTSTYDSAESIATLPPESDLDDEQIRNMLASPLHFAGERSKCRPSRVYHSFKENSVFSSSHFRESAGKPEEGLSSQETLSDREGVFPQDINQFREKTELYSGSQIRKKLRD